MGQSHSRIKAGVLSALEARGWLVISFPSNGMTGPGVVDNLAVVPPEGWTLAIEAKTPGDAPRTDDPRWLRQQRFMRRVVDCGGIAVWGYTVKEILDRIDLEVETRRRREVR